MPLLLVILACIGDAAKDDSGADDSGADDSGADDSAGGDSAGGDSVPACATLNSGDDWAFAGACPRMRTPCDIVVTGCTLTIDYAADGGMTMGMPYGGTIEGDTIAFSDGDSVTGCVGTIEDPDTVSGTCEGGCEFTLRR